MTKTTEPTQLEDARKTVLTYLAAMEDRRLGEARSHVANDVIMVFPGGRKFGSVDEIAANSRGRYSEVRKSIERAESWRCGRRIMVLVTGTLYGHLIDGEAFEGIRFADRFELSEGKIIRQEVWNDVGERRLASANAKLEQAARDTK